MKRRVCLLACGAVFFLTAGSAPPREDERDNQAPERFVDPEPTPARAAIDRLIEEGRRLEAAGRRDRALARYAAALSLDPQNDMARQSVLRLALGDAEAPDEAPPASDSELAAELLRLRGDIAEGRRQRDELRREMARLEGSLNAQISNIARLTAAMDDRGRAEPIVSRLDRSISELERRLSRFDTDINSVRRDVNRLEREISSLRTRVR